MSRLQLYQPTFLLIWYNFRQLQFDMWSRCNYQSNTLVKFRCWCGIKKGKKSILN